jgi:hypothetical protein
MRLGELDQREAVCNDTTPIDQTREIYESARPVLEAISKAPVAV